MKTTVQLFLTILILSFNAIAGQKVLGSSCAFDGQCLSGECKGFSCIPLNENAKVTGNETLDDVLNKFHEITPILNEAGFEVGMIQVEIRLIPKIMVYVEQNERMTKVNQRKMLNKYKDRIYVKALLKTLFIAHSLKFDHYVSNVSMLQLNPPKATLFLNKKGEKGKSFFQKYFKN